MARTRTLAYIGPLSSYETAVISYKTCIAVTHNDTVTKDITDFRRCCSANFGCPIASVGRLGRELWGNDSVRL